MLMLIVVIEQIIHTAYTVTTNGNIEISLSLIHIQYMYGTDFLVAPVYQKTQADEKGNDIRDGLYLPAGSWIDYFSGEKYEGNCILNNFDTPIWKLPVFVKNGSIIPMTRCV